MTGAKYLESKSERGMHELKEAGHLSFFIGKDMSYVDEVGGILSRHVCTDKIKADDKSAEEADKAQDEESAEQMDAESNQIVDSAENRDAADTNQDEDQNVNQ